MKEEGIEVFEVFGFVDNVIKGKGGVGSGGVLTHEVEAKVVIFGAVKDKVLLIVN